MKTILTHFTICTVSLFFLSSCDKGPSGPNPGQELVIYYDSGILKGLVYTKSADLQMFGELVIPTFYPMTRDTIIPGRAQFGGGSGVVWTPVVDLYFEKNLPTSPGSYSWKETVVSPSYSRTVEAGPVIYYDTRFYYPVSGTTVITEVFRDGSGNVTHLAGYFNGQLRAQWPGGGSTPPNPLPPGFDSANPKLVGETLTVSSCVFYTRSRSAAKPG
ncbi:MAG: hypothetical protein HYX66_09795 [Ignavibacteria bacterium]|nr:hypothetical protein [Ignavibacteria bacterium]